MSSIKELSALPDACPIEQITLTVKHPFEIREHESAKDGSKWKSQGAYVTDEAGDECSLSWSNPGQALEKGEVISVGHYQQKGCTTNHYTSKAGTPDEKEVFQIRVSGKCLKRQGETVGQAPATTTSSAIAQGVAQRAGKVTDQEILEALPGWFKMVEKATDQGPDLGYSYGPENFTSIVCSMLIAVAKGDVVIEKPKATTSNTSGEFDSSADDDDIPF